MISRLAGMAAVVSVCVGAMAGWSPTMAAAAPSGQMLLTGDAYGSVAVVGVLVQAPKTAAVGLGGGTDCQPQALPAHRSDTLASQDAAPYVSSAEVSTTADADSGSIQSVSTRADILHVSLLGGNVTGDEIVAASSASFDGSAFHAGADGSQFANVVVGGQSISGTPPPNTRVDLPGFGYAILNEQTSSVSPSSASMIVNMIHVYVTVQNDLVPVGTKIIVSHAAASVQPAPAGSLDGSAYGSFAGAQSNTLSGPSAAVSVPCQGTGGAVTTKTVASVSQSPEFTAGTITDTAVGTVTSTTAGSETTSEVQSANVAQGLVGANVMKADAHATKAGSKMTFSDSGTQFDHLVVQGHPEIGDQVAPNTRIRIAGLGTLWLRREITTPNSIEIRMVELIVDQTNSYGIPVGTDIRMAVAEASVH